MYLDCLHCVSQLHQLELYIQFLGVIFLVWHDEMILLPSLCYTGLASFLDYFKVALSNITLVCLLVFVLFSFISYSHYYYYCPDFVLHPHSFRVLLDTPSTAQWASPWYLTQLKDHAWFSQDFSLTCTSWPCLLFRFVEISLATSEHPQNKSGNVLLKAVFEYMLWIYQLFGAKLLEVKLILNVQDKHSLLAW